MPGTTPIRGYTRRGTYSERSVDGLRRSVESQPLGPRLSTTVVGRLLRAVKVVDEQDSLAKEHIGHQRIVVPDGQQQDRRRQAVRSQTVATTTVYKAPVDTSSSAIAEGPRDAAMLAGSWES